jgi:hypothetical protein
MDFIRFNTTGAVPYNQGGTIKRVDNCNGFIAINTGDVIATVNDTILYPGVIGTVSGESKVVGGNLGEIFLGIINLKFTGAGANPEVTIEQKFYILDSQNDKIVNDYV